MLKLNKKGIEFVNNLNKKNIPFTCDETLGIVTIIVHKGNNNDIPVPFTKNGASEYAEKQMQKALS